MFVLNFGILIYWYECEEVFIILKGYGILYFS